MLVFQNENSVGNYNYNAFIYDACQWGYHFHKNYELIYVMKGELWVSSSGTEYTMTENEFSLILPNSIHSLHASDDSMVWIGVFSSDYVSDFDTFMEGKANKSNTFCVEDALMPYLKKYLLVTHKPELFNLKAMLYAICHEYIKNADFYQRKIGDDIPMKIFEYVQNNFKSDISLKSVAYALGYNYQYMSKIYENIFHINFRTFLNRFRLDYAQTLLTKTRLSVTEIAMQSGFGSIRTMNRHFLKEYNLTPKSIRNTLMRSKAEVNMVSKGDFR